MHKISNTFLGVKTPAQARYHDGAWEGTVPGTMLDYADVYKSASDGKAFPQYFQECEERWQVRQAAERK